MGAVTKIFLFTDIEGSTRLWETRPVEMSQALQRHDAALREAVVLHGGQVFKTVGDAFCAAFPSPESALAAAVDAQRAVRSIEVEGPLRVRMALHAGSAETRDDDYFGPTLNRVARILSTVSGAQAVVSEAVRAILTKNVDGLSLRDLGEHRLKDLDAPERLYQVVHPDLEDDFPPLRSLSVLPNNLPEQLTSFVGRQREIADVEAMLSHRLVTLVGAGGTGKTRLALQVAAASLERYSDGVWLVELASVADPEAIVGEAMRSLGVKEQAGRPLLETLREYCREREILLILDNCEHVIASCARLAENLARACPRLTILSTSRQPLGVSGERTYRVPSLLTPDLAVPQTAATLADYDSARLFQERASLAHATFTIDDDNAEAVSQVLTRLDGIPLALELAAARVRAMPVERIAERLDDRFRLLTGGSRNALPRQQTLRALVDWSYSLLSEAERVLLQRLSIFAGGWTLEAAEEVGAADEAERWEVMDLLQALVDQSLVVYEPGVERYRLLETVRAYAREMRDPEDDASGRHAAFFARLIAETVPKLMGPDQAKELNRLEADLDNLRNALAHQIAHDPVGALATANATFRFWNVRGFLADGRSFLERALAAAPPGAPGRNRALVYLGGLVSQQGDQARAKELAGLALAGSTADGNISDQALSGALLGMAQIGLGDFAAAREAMIATLDRWRALGETSGIASALTNLAEAERLLGRYEQAEAAIEEALTLWQPIGNLHAMAVNLNNLARIRLRLRRLEGAWDSGREAFTIRLGLQDAHGLSMSLNVLGAIEIARGHMTEAVRLLAAAERLREEKGIALRKDEEGDVATALGEARQSLDRTEYDLAYAAGRTTPVERLLEGAAKSSSSVAGPRGLAS